MDSARDIIIRSTGWASLRSVAKALQSIDGVEHAVAKPRNGVQGIEVVGLLTVNEDSDLTPSGVLDHIRKNHPSFCWPDWVLVAFQSPAQAYSRRAA